jgi:hypothetical protein
MEFPTRYDRATLKRQYVKLALSDETVDLLHRYFDAMAGLYQVIPLETAYEIIKSQNMNFISKGKFAEFSNIARREKHRYFILGLEDLYLNEKTEKDIEREIVHEDLVDFDLDYYYHVAEGQQGKPYHVPLKKELLRYSEPFYEEETEHTRAMLRFIKNELKYEDGSAPDDETAEGVLSDFIVIIRASGPEPLETLKDIMYVIERMKLAFENEGKAHEFIKLYNNFYNNTRLPINRGHTPGEISEIEKLEGGIPKTVQFGPKLIQQLRDGEWDMDELRKMLMGMDYPSEELRIETLRKLEDIDNEIASSKAGAAVKPGRNDPCPCGSGEKYKNCCGR